MPDGSALRPDEVSAGFEVLTLPWNVGYVFEDGTAFFPEEVSVAEWVRRFLRLSYGDSVDSFAINEIEIETSENGHPEMRVSVNCRLRPNLQAAPISISINQAVIKGGADCSDGA